MYLFLLRKKPQEQELLWDRIKEKNNEKYGALLASLSEYIFASGKKNYDERVATSLLIYNLLLYLKTEGVIKRVGVLKKTPSGKPYLDGGEINISISHTEDLITVAASMEHEIGVDAEQEIPGERAAKLESRFFSDFDLPEGNMASKRCGVKDKDIEIFELFEVGFERVEMAVADSSFTKKWTLAEAIMKCEGDGFSALHRLSDLAEEMTLFSFVYDLDGKNVYISLALK